MVLTSMAQSNTQLGIKVGVSRVGTFARLQNKYTPSITPVLGLEGQWRLDKRFGIRAALQTQTSSGTYRNRTLSSSFGREVIWEVDSRFSLTKFTGPVVITYDILSSKKGAIGLQVGVKPTLVLAGEDYHSYTRHEEGQSSNESTSLNLVDKTGSEYIRRFNGQCVTGLAFRWSSRWSASMMYSFGPDYEIRYNREECLPSSYKNDDVEFTITYFPKF